MPQRGDNPNEVLYEDNTPFGYRVTNYYDFEQLICRDPFDALAAIEEQFYCPLAFVNFRKEQCPRYHHLNYLKQQPITDKPTLTHEQLIAIDTESDRLLEFFIHERITNHG